MKKNKLLFWQPKVDLLKVLIHTRYGKYFLIFFNYIIWIFLFYISYLLVKKDANIFWQLFLSVIVTEIIERYIKGKVFWQRPLFSRKDKVPDGLVKKWYQTGSFPSGHTIKSTYYFLFVLQYLVFNPSLFSAIVFPLLMFRVLMGFHYPIDIIGGILVGTINWFLVKDIVFPENINFIIQTIFNYVFFIRS